MSPQKECSCGKAYWPSQAWIHAACNDKRDDDVVTKVANAVVTEDQSGEPKVGSQAADESPAPSRQVVWQRANRDRYNARMRAYRAARRAA